jgi:hypothetical protein
MSSCSSGFVFLVLVVVLVLDIVFFRRFRTPMDLIFVKAPRFATVLQIWLFEDEDEYDDEYEDDVRTSGSSCLPY